MRVSGTVDLSVYQRPKNKRIVTMSHLFVPERQTTGPLGLSFLGSKYHFGAGALRLPLSRQVLEEKLVQKLLCDNLIELAPQIEEQKMSLLVTGSGSVLVLRKRGDDGEKFDIFVVYREGEVPLNLSKGLKCLILQKTVPDDDNFVITDLTAKRKDFECIELPLNERVSFPLLEGDTILAPLGVPKEKPPGKKQIWLPLVCSFQSVRPSDAQKLLDWIVDGPQIVVQESIRRFGHLSIALGREVEEQPPHHMPGVTQVCQVIGASQSDLRPKILGWVKELQEKGVSSLLDQIESTELRVRIIKMADESRPMAGSSWSEAEFRQLMAMNWLLKERAFVEITTANNYRMAEEVGRLSNTAILALTENGSLMAISPVFQSQMITEEILGSGFAEAQMIFNALVRFGYLHRDGRLRSKMFSGKDAFVKEFEPPFGLDQKIRGELFDFLEPFMVRDIQYERIRERADNGLPEVMVRGQGNLSKDIAIGRRIHAFHIITSRVVKLAVNYTGDMAEFQRSSQEVHRDFTIVCRIIWPNG
ncbi:MAG: hypothetical protein ABIJ26_06040 [Candidatus Margulisiibacteriota bacterium]|nr:hypothetical protein [Candidatus Margulisiibacteriota bacterium]